MIAVPLTPPELDDRRFQDIVDEAKRLIPQYCPEWTNHNVSDPGVALIELFAWMSEMVLFRYNQVPERLYVHFLNLVGIDPFPPSVARADLTFWLTSVTGSPVVVPAGTEVTTAAGAALGTSAPGTATGAGPETTADAVAFTTTDELVVAPPELTTAATLTAETEHTTDVWDDLRFDPRGVRCFTADPLTPGDAFCLGFRQSLAGIVLRLWVEASAEGIGVDPTNPPLAWEVWNGEAWIQTTVFEDTTGGLNRPGEVVLLVPREHGLSTLGSAAAYWLRVRLLSPEPGQPTYQASPRIRSVQPSALGGTVSAEHAEQMPGELVGRSNGKPGQAFTVSRTPVLPRRRDERVRVVSAEGEEQWTEVSDFTATGPDDLHYVWESGSGTIHFGPRVRYPDGTARQHGRVPRDGAEIHVTRYRRGGGARGNVGARTLTELRSTIPFVSGVTNLTPATGGVDAESVAEAKVRGPLTLRTGHRAVTAGDYERLTKEASIEVARTRCLPAARGNGAVRLLVVPRVRREVATHRLDDFAISEPLMERITTHLNEHRLVGTSLEVSTPYYQGVSVAALVHAGPGRPPGLVRQRAIDVLTRYLNPLAGGPDGTGWPFDSDVNAATVAQLLESVEGLERVEEALLFEYDLRSGHRLGSGKDVIRLDTHSLFLSAGHQVVVR